MVFPDWPQSAPQNQIRNGLNPAPVSGFPTKANNERTEFGCTFEPG